MTENGPVTPSMVKGWREKNENMTLQRPGFGSEYVCRCLGGYPITHRLHTGAEYNLDGAPVLTRRGI